MKSKTYAIGIRISKEMMEDDLFGDPWGLWSKTQLELRPCEMVDNCEHCHCEVCGSEWSRPIGSDTEWHETHCCWSNK